VKEKPARFALVNCGLARTGGMVSRVHARNREFGSGRAVNAEMKGMEK